MKYFWNMFVMRCCMSTLELLTKRMSKVLPKYQRPDDQNIDCIVMNRLLQLNWKPLFGWTVFDKAWQVCIYFRYWLLPGFVLKKMIMDNFQVDQVDPDVADAIDFMVERVRSLNFAKHLIKVWFWNMVSTLRECSLAFI